MWYLYFPVPLFTESVWFLVSIFTGSLCFLVPNGYLCFLMSMFPEYLCSPGIYVHHYLCFLSPTFFRSLFLSSLCFPDLHSMDPYVFLVPIFVLPLFSSIYFTWGLCPLVYMFPCIYVSHYLCYLDPFVFLHFKYLYCPDGNIESRKHTECIREHRYGPILPYEN